MRISGYGEFQQLRKLIQKDEAAQDREKNGDGGAAEAQGPAGGDSDAVHISSAAKQKARLRAASDYRETKVAEVREKLEAGTLVTPESLRGGAAKMLDSLVAGDL